MMDLLFQVQKSAIRVSLLHQHCRNPHMTVDEVVKKIRRFQVHEINEGRTVYSENHYLFPILKKYEDKFKRYTRMPLDTFNYILSKIMPSLEKNWCNFHTQPIEAEERLVITLRYIMYNISVFISVSGCVYTKSVR